MFDKLSIVGGDLRIVKLVEYFAAEGTMVYTYGLDCVQELKNNQMIKSLNSLDEFVNTSKYIISGIPLSKDEINLNAPYSKEVIKLETLINKIYNKTFIAGKIEKDLMQKLKKQNNNVIDLMEDEVLTVYNAVATVEGAIASVISKTEFTLFRSNILILGYGRIGKLLANRLKNFEPNIYCETGKDDAVAWINSNGYTSVKLEELENFLSNTKIDVIINTIPKVILNEKVLNLVSSKVFILDLASSPGGVDNEYAKKKNISCEWLLSIPGKVAHASAAKFIKERIEKLVI